MKTHLEPYRGDPDALRFEKTKLLKTFSGELSRNIFFTSEEARDVIRNLAAHELL